MRHLFAAAVAAGLFASMAQAAVLRAAYDFEAQLADYTLYDYGTGETYAGPPIGSVGDFTFTVTFEPNPSEWGHDSVVSRFDRDTGAGSFFIHEREGVQVHESYSFDADGTGKYYDWTQYPMGSRVQFDYDILSWNVDIAPIPLPASLPLLGVGIAAVGFVARRRKTSRGT